jgi:biofilm protein TabA
MITGNLKDAEKYSFLGKRIAEAFTAASELFYHTPEVGCHEIDGRNLYANVQKYVTVPFDTANWEAHREYLDLQVVVSGHEKMGYAHIDKLQPVTDYDESKDYQMLSGNGSQISLSAGDFMLLYPEDAHMPKCIDSVAEDVLKIIIKIKL